MKLTYKVINHNASIYFKKNQIKNLVLIEEAFDVKKIGWSGKNYYWLNENNISPLIACISFINKIKHLDGVIIGIETLKQLNLILNLKVKKLNFDKLAIRKKKIIYPQNWLQK